MNETLLFNIARNITEAFLLTLGIIPSMGEDTLETQDYGPHRIFTYQVRVPDSLASAIDGKDVLDKLVSFLDYHNAIPTSVQLYPYNVEVYICPCGCGTLLYISVYHDA